MLWVVARMGRILNVWLLGDEMRCSSVCSAWSDVKIAAVRDRRLNCGDGPGGNLYAVLIMGAICRGLRGVEGEMCLNRGAWK